MNHTPGPWRVEDERIVTGFVDDRIEVYTGEEGREGDLSLIAAAPDLLAACVAAESALQCTVNGELLAEHFPKKLAVLRATIAKAKAE
ncbi:MAG: hypothetical protein ABIK89_18990 [Planctomycetota bacterium]